MSALAEDLCADSDEIVAEVLAAHPADRHDEQWVSDVTSQIQRTGQFRMVELAVAHAGVYTPTDPDRVADYARLDGAQAPPVVLVWEYGCPDPGLVLCDGAHRARAALVRGEGTLAAWVPEDWQPTLTIRRAAPADRPALAQILADPDATRFIGGVAMMDACLADPGQVALVACDTDLVVAWVSLDATADIDIAVHPDWRGRGYATQILHALPASEHVAQFGELHATVADDNPASLAALRAAGWEELDDEDGDSAGPDDLTFIQFVACVSA